MRKIVVGSRQSALAMTQTNQVIEDLKRLAERLGVEAEFEIRKIVTKGDQILDVTLSKVGGKGLFVKEIEQAMMDREIDIAVHSMKDVPSELPEGLVIGAVPKRIDPRDVLITREAGSLDELPQGAKIGTSSLRRGSQMKHYRPDFNVEWIRGNIDTRLKKLESEGFDAILLAAAGLKRIGWEDKATAFLDPEVCLPAVGQGALGIECRENDDFVMALLQAYDHADSRLATDAERSFLARLNGGCQVPIGAYAEVADSGDITLTGMVGSPDGTQILRDSHTGKEPIRLGLEVAERLAAKGAEQILDKWRG